MDAAAQPTRFPFRQVVLKVASRCDLACDYCYIYTAGDESWRSRPRLMSPAVASATARRIAEHGQAHGMTSVRVILHGGEPLLAGPEGLDRIAHILRGILGSKGIRLDLSVQTNGVQLDERFLTVFHRHRVRVGVSIDGTAADHDAHRRRPNGRGSHADVAQALQLLARPEHQNLYAGLLCVVNPTTDPRATYEALLTHRPPRIDLLLPHGTWTSPPPGRKADAPGTPYADWLIAVFDQWYAEPSHRIGIRMFESIVGQLFGAPSLLESFGLGPADVVTVETDGRIEQVDSLKAAAPGAAATQLSVWSDRFDQALEHPGIHARQQGLSTLAAVCQRCPVLAVCGGGLYTHRYSDGSFDHPSVYCPDLFQLITHIADVVRRDVRTRQARTFPGVDAVEGSCR